MVRPLRVEFADGIYHLTSRGNARREIVADDVDRDKWVELLQRSVEQHRWRVFGLGLLSNHYHIFLQTPEPNLSKGMQHLTTAASRAMSMRATVRVGICSSAVVADASASWTGGGDRRGGRTFWGGCVDMGRRAPV